MKAKVIDQEGETLTVELENGVKRVIKINRAVDLRGKEVLLVKPCIKHAWKRHFWEGYL